MFVSASIFLDALFLLLGDNSDRSRQIVKDFMEIVNKNNTKRDITSLDDDLIAVYKNLINTVLNEKISQDNKTAAKILHLKIKSMEIFKHHPVERDLLTDVLTSHEPITAEQIDQYLKRLRNELISAEMNQVARKILAKTSSVSAVADIDEQTIEIAKIKALFDDSVKTIEQRQSTSNAKASESFVSLSDKESILRSIDTFMDRNVRSVVKTGLHGLNRALGNRGGFGLGDTVVFAASSHNYKSGMLVSILIWTVVYNTFVIEPGKKAMVYFVSLENEVSQNLMDVFRNLYCRIEKKAIDTSTMSTEFITDWLHNFFSQFQVEVYIDRYTPHDFSYRKFEQRYNAFVDLGYQIILFDLDYMSEARGIDPGDTFSTQGQIQLIKENYTKFAAHAKSQGYLMTTGHQLTKKAEEMASGDRYAVKKFNAHLMADSSDVHRIVDVLFFLQLANNVNGHKFLMIQNRKNRTSKDTLENHKFCAYPFTVFGIEDDFLGAPNYVTDIDMWGIDEGVEAHAIVESAMF